MCSRIVSNYGGGCVASTRVGSSLVRMFVEAEERQDLLGFVGELGRDQEAVAAVDDA